MAFIRRLLLLVFVLCALVFGVLLGVKNATFVSFSLVFFILPSMPLGLLVLVALALGFLVGSSVGGLSIFRSSARRKSKA